MSSSIYEGCFDEDGDDDKIFLSIDLLVSSFSSISLNNNKERLEIDYRWELT